MEELYSIKEAARLLGGISQYTVEAWLSKGKLRRTKVGRRTMIRKSELQRFIEEANVTRTTASRDLAFQTAQLENQMGEPK